jgi:hypothetical protein
MNGYQLTRRWFDFAFKNSEVKSQHTALYCWMVELNNRLQWKESFGLPTHEACEFTGIGNRNTFYAAIEDLEKWGFIETINKSNNQNTSRIISLRLSEFDQAEVQPMTKQSSGGGTSTAPIVKQYKQLNNKITKEKKEAKKFIAPSIDEVRSYFEEKGFPTDLVQQVYSHYADADWTKANGGKVLDWKRTISNNWQEKFDRHKSKPNHQNANQTYYPPKPENDPILLRQEVHSNYEEYVRHCLKVNHQPEKPKYPELVPPDFDHIAFINQIKANL